MMNRKALSLLEVFLAAGLLTIAILPLLWMTKYSNKSSMDAYYETIALTLAKEPIEIFRGLGYEWLAANPDNPHPDYYIGEQQIPGDGIKRPVETSSFKRKIELKILSAEKAAHVTVTVYPAGQNRVQAWMSGSAISMDALIFARSK
ncbi:MAG: hypothetical protein HQM10_03155 [Candidatus Riflebacteria bacterium]|nr:hypothetical protein [Candidatus Riflebacteria bacterium]